MALCKEPEDLKTIMRTITRQLIEYQSHVAQYYSNPRFMETHREHLNNTLSKDTLEVMSKSSSFLVLVHGESRCKRLRDINRMDANDDINTTTVEQLATCPWHVTMDYDDNRIPANIMKAVCTCRKCYRNDGSRDLGGRCEPVETFTPVTRKVCVKGVYQYVVAIESIPVGCTCKRNLERKAKRQEH